MCLPPWQTQKAFLFLMIILYSSVTFKVFLFAVGFLNSLILRYLRVIFLHLFFFIAVGLWLDVFLQFWKIFGHIFSKFCFCPFSVILSLELNCSYVKHCNTSCVFYAPFWLLVFSIDLYSCLPMLPLAISDL
jgi:hypothetical protein